MFWSPTDEVELTILHGIRHCQNFYRDCLVHLLRKRPKLTVLLHVVAAEEELLRAHTSLGTRLVHVQVSHNQCLNYL